MMNGNQLEKAIHVYSDTDLDGQPTHWVEVATEEQTLQTVSAHIQSQKGVERIDYGKNIVNGKVTTHMMRIFTASRYYRQKIGLMIWDFLDTRSHTIHTHHEPADKDTLRRIKAESKPNGYELYDEHYTRTQQSLVKCVECGRYDRILRGAKVVRYRTMSCWECKWDARFIPRTNEEVAV